MRVHWRPIWWGRELNLRTSPSLFWWFERGCKGVHICTTVHASIDVHYMSPVNSYVLHVRVSFSLSLNVPGTESPLSFSLFLTLSIPVPSSSPRRSPSFLMLGSYSRRAERAKKKLRSIFITQTDRAGRPSGAHKKCLFTYGDWSAETGVMPLALFFVLPFFCYDAGKKCAPHVDWSRGQMT